MEMEWKTGTKPRHEFYVYVLLSKCHSIQSTHYGFMYKPHFFEKKRLPSKKTSFFVYC